MENAFADMSAFSRTSLSTTTTCLSRSMTISRVKSSGEVSLKETEQVAWALTVASMLGRTWLYLPLFMTGTLPPIRWTKANFVRFNRPSPKLSRTSPKVTRSSCFIAHSLISSTEPHPPPTTGSAVESGPIRIQFHSRPSTTAFKPSSAEVKASLFDSRRAANFSCLFASASASNLLRSSSFRFSASSFSFASWARYSLMLKEAPEILSTTKCFEAVSMMCSGVTSLTVLSSMLVVS
mmetsp:Transcript_57465/g.125884  ORF Transcript_57465/g.125884 Transcript_57465/m.125884 type:complete len:237 (+) Transcript_57465:1574-2284(+)